MTAPLILALAACAFAATMTGGLLALKLVQTRLPLVMGFSAGAVIGVAFFDMAPEALAAGAGLYARRAPCWPIAALGFFLYAVLDRLVARHDCENQPNPARGLVGRRKLFSAHSVLDGFRDGHRLPDQSAGYRVGGGCRGAGA